MKGADSSSSLPPSASRRTHHATARASCRSAKGKDGAITTKRADKADRPFSPAKPAPEAGMQLEPRSWPRILTLGVAAFLLMLGGVINVSRFKRELGDMNAYTSVERSFLWERKHHKESISFEMCGRVTPFVYDVDPSLPPARRRPIIEERVEWPKGDGILLLRNDGKFGHMGNQINSLLHAFDYARDNGLHIGILFHSWAMDTIQTMFYETDDFDVLAREILDDLDVLVVRNQTQLEGYKEVISQNAQQLYFYRSSNAGMDHWRETMDVHVKLLRRMYLRYNRGYGYVHNGLRAQDMCATLDMLFHERTGDVKYTVIHSRWLDGNAEWRLERISKKTGLTIEGGALYMAPAYVKAILKPLGMLDYPIILLTDGQLPSVERGLFGDPVIGPNLMVLSEKTYLTEADVALAVLSDVFIGNPASVTSGFIARSRIALGYSDKSTQLFRRKRVHQWYSVCNSECVFNPWILGQWV